MTVVDDIDVVVVLGVVLLVIVIEIEVDVEVEVEVEVGGGTTDVLVDFKHWYWGSRSGVQSNSPLTSAEQSLAITYIPSVDDGTCKSRSASRFACPSVLRLTSVHRPCSGPPNLHLRTDLQE